MKRLRLIGFAVLFVWGCGSDDGSATAATADDAPSPDAASDGAIDATSLDAARMPDLDGHLPEGPNPLTPDMPCNGNTSYCAMRYDQWCQVATEDSAAITGGYWQFPTQAQSIRYQLDNGVRALSLGAQSAGRTVNVCRGDCAEGNAPLAMVLGSVKDFLGANAREVVTLLIDGSVDAGDIQAEFAAQGLDLLAHAQATGAPWPTLGELIASGKRLVVLANTADGTADAGAVWLLPRSALVWETDSNWTSLGAMSCNPAIGDASRPLYLVHHGLYNELDGAAAEPNQDLVAQANAFATVAARLEVCKAQHGRAPNFVAVDFFDVGDPVGATQVMNGVRAAP